MWYFKILCVILMSVHATCVQKPGVNASRRIYGGSHFKITDSPFLALIFYPSHVLHCGASILQPQFLVSTAHCFVKRVKHYAKVGTDDLNDGSGSRYEIDRVFNHPNFTATTVFHNDLSIILLKKNLSYSDSVRPIALPPNNLVLESGMTLESMGFGFTERDRVSHYLLKVKLPYVDQNTCSSKLNLTITSSMMCAGGVAGKDTCKGDSGGPLVYNNTLVGIVSFGQGCGKTKPAVYTRVSHYNDFIVKTINQTLSDINIIKRVFDILNEF